MKWYRININYLFNETDKLCIETSSPCGQDKEKAIEKYFRDTENPPKCVDDKSKTAKINLTEYIYSTKTNNTRTVILYKNY